MQTILNLISTKLRRSLALTLPILLFEVLLFNFTTPNPDPNNPNNCYGAATCGFGVQNVHCMFQITGDEVVEREEIIELVRYLSFTILHVFNVIYMQANNLTKIP